MSIILVTRHIGALKWFEEQGIYADLTLEQFDLSLVSQGDVVLGNLPLPIVAELCDRGIAYYHLEFTTPVEFRGQELTVDQLYQLGAKLVAYEVKRLDELEDSLLS